MKKYFSKLFSVFVNENALGGFVLIICTVLSLLIANSVYGKTYVHFWELKLFQLPFHFPNSVLEIINELGMSIFFLLVGLEIERELYAGELSNKKVAILPAIAALGGMIFPAIFFFFVVINQPHFYSGAGIPTATDIAFSLAVIKLLGKRVPIIAVVLLTALAIFDDLGAIFVIAIFYGQKINWICIVLSMFICVILFVLNKKKIEKSWIFILLGISLWTCMYYSGIHAAISGVILAFALPFGTGKENSISYIWEKRIVVPVNYLILPLFALANTAIPINLNLEKLLIHPIGIGIIVGLVLGKPIGILVGIYSAKLLKLIKLPNDITLKNLVGIGFLAGIGFTMAMFVANLAFQSTSEINIAKISIIFGSVLSAIIGYCILRFFK